ncbi:MAG TPA: PTS fructose transporter subunit IIA [Rhodobacteraceae bacterium]|nr:PTS fructose transporter subunit IIA [Paracoccaceae bacterium]
MIGIVIVAHGGLAAEYLLAMEHVVGKKTGTRAISISRDDDREAKKTEIRLAVNEVDDGDGVVVVTDIFGGTPSNLAINACESGARKIIYGASLPLLVKLAKSRHLPLDESTRCACEAGRKYMNSMEPCIKSED